MLGLLDTDDTGASCCCTVDTVGDTLIVDASSCPGAGDLSQAPDCRATVTHTLTEQDVTEIRLHTDGIERIYDAEATAFLATAGRFAERVSVHDERLAQRARRDPLGAAREAAGRPAPMQRLAAETGLADIVDTSPPRTGHMSTNPPYESALSAHEGPRISHWRVDTHPPDSCELLDVRDLNTGSKVRCYSNPGPDRYHLVPLGATLDHEALSVLGTAYDRLARGDIEEGKMAPARAIHGAVADAECMDRGSAPIDDLIDVLEKHTRQFGLLTDFFADPRLTDVFLTAPAGTNAIRVTVDGETFVTNVRPTERCLRALRSRFRRRSGRGFSHAQPTLDATITVAGRRVRVAGVREPTSTGTAFAFRGQDRTAWTLPALVANGTLTAPAAGLLSVAVEHGASILCAGPRGAGKTTTLGALLWELPAHVRAVVIEDTPELPVTALQEQGRDVQPLRAGQAGGELSPAEALRTALRLGNGALVVGEVRGEEAAALYEAMRVGANSEAVLGTIHGDGGADVFERVVSDLGVPASSFGVTDLLVTLAETDNGKAVRCIEEVVGGESPQFEALFERGNLLEPTGRIDRGNSHLVEALCRPGESYAALLEKVTARTQQIGSLAESEQTSPGAVTEAVAKR